MLALEGLTRQHEGASSPSVAGVDLEVQSGEVLVLVGPSGCGKSTILRLIAGLDVPDAGKVVLGGRDLARVAPQDRDVAMVFQGYALYPNLSARNNIAFPLKMRKTPRDERDARVLEAAKLLSIEHLLDRRPDELSGGERQRVAMGRAIVRRPKLFLFDEPLSNLDAALRATLRVELASLLRSVQATAVYVTHDQVEAMTIGHRIAVMQKGSILQTGAPQNVYKQPENLFVAEFLGSTRINAISVVREGGHMRALGNAIEIPESDVDIVMGIRPEDLELRSPIHNDANPKSGIVWKAVVKLVEPLGSETIVHCNIDGQTLRARIPGFSDLALGDSTDLVVSMDKILWFNAASGQRISRV
jgi:multiple sugar transport system ATP-binding protein